MGMEIYCSQLGMMIEFSYCITMNEGLPCRNTIGCWQERIDIIALLKERFTADELQKVFGTLPKSKIDRIIDGITKTGKS